MYDIIVLCVHNTLTSIVLGIISTFWAYNNDLTTCSIDYILRKVTSTITGNHLALISFVRYHLAKKTENCKAENLPLIISLSIATYAIEYVSDVILVMLGQYDLHQLTCMDSIDHISPAAPVIAIVKGIIILLVGIFFDGCMIIFLKKRNKIGGGQGIGKHFSHVMLMKIMSFHYLLCFYRN